MRYHYTAFRVAKNLKRNNHVEQIDLSYCAGGNAKWYRHFAQKFGSFL